MVWADGRWYTKAEFAAQIGAGAARPPPPPVPPRSSKAPPHAPAPSIAVPLLRVPPAPPKAAPREAVSEAAAVQRGTVGWGDTPLHWDLASDLAPTARCAVPKCIHCGREIPPWEPLWARVGMGEDGRDRTFEEADAQVTTVVVPTGAIAELKVLPGKAGVGSGLRVASASGGLQPGQQITSVVGFTEPPADALALAEEAMADVVVEATEAVLWMHPHCEAAWAEEVVAGWRAAWAEEDVGADDDERAAREETRRKRVLGMRRSLPAPKEVRQSRSNKRFYTRQQFLRHYGTRCEWDACESSRRCQHDTAASAVSVWAWADWLGELVGCGGRIGEVEGGSLADAQGLLPFQGRNVVGINGWDVEGGGEKLASVLRRLADLRPPATLTLQFTPPQGVGGADGPRPRGRGRGRGAHFEAGDSVQVSGLADAAHLNGAIGKVVAQAGSDGRVRVDLGAGGLRAVRAVNLRLLSADEREEAALRELASEAAAAAEMARQRRGGGALRRLADHVAAMAADEAPRAGAGLEESEGSGSSSDDTSEAETAEGRRLRKMIRRFKRQRKKADTAERLADVESTLEDLRNALGAERRCRKRRAEDRGDDEVLEPGSRRRRPDVHAVECPLCGGAVEVECVGGDELFTCPCCGGGFVA
eukprot:TRINITY_DN5284_c3_g1_i1.p1 TRINITY_DN5284_c3_g1~~TRINITY_DN5284_c3_g1_i1.p1  ORF type:complete len:716 (+),score=202.74 TRINITY_DN5284_c3_g1_i1:209-2149(+)